MYWFDIISLVSNQSKEAFADWARHDDAQDHFCELDGEDFNFHWSFLVHDSSHVCWLHVNESKYKQRKLRLCLWTFLFISSQPCVCCCVSDETSPDAEYVDLLPNPERFTGYKGPSAWRVWNSIYEENCFKWDLNTHSDTVSSTHTSKTYCVIKLQKNILKICK